MYSKEELRRKITELYPDIGKCEINITVDYDSKKKIWLIDLKKDTHELKHHLELSEANACMENKQGVPLGWRLLSSKKISPGSSTNRKLTSTETSTPLHAIVHHSFGRYRNLAIDTCREIGTSRRLP